MASLACGVPTVTTIGVWSEPVWRAARGAIELAPAGDVPAIVDRCRRLANDPARRAALGVAGREFYERHFTIERTVRVLCGADDTNPSVLLGVQAHPGDRGDRTPPAGRPRRHRRAGRRPPGEPPVRVVECAAARSGRLRRAARALIRLPITSPAARVPGNRSSRRCSTCWPAGPSRKAVPISRT